MSTWESIFPEAGGNLPYLPLVPYSVRRMSTATFVNVGVINRDYLTAFVARADVTINRVFWVRGVVTAANVFVGIYSGTGTLLTDCALDSGTVVGLHQVTTTNVTLVAGQLYYFALNQSALVSVSSNVTDASALEIVNYFLTFQSIDLLIYTTLPSHNASVTTSASKSRTTAIMPATQTMTGWDQSGLAVYGGFVPI